MGIRPGQGTIGIMDINQLTVGIIQCEITAGEPLTNLYQITQSLRRLAEAQIHLAVLPELWSCGYDLPRIHEHAKKTPELIDNLSKFARSHQIMIAGSLPEWVDGRIYNTFFLIDEHGKIAGAYRKIHLFRMLKENEVFHPGRQPVVCKTSFGIMGLMICYDLRFPELARSLALKGAQLILVCAQWPMPRIAHWDVLVSARAIENQVFMVACNRCGTEKDLEFNGHSQIISPFGKTLGRLDDVAGIVHAKIDLNEISLIKQQMNCLDDRNPEAYGL